VITSMLAGAALLAVGLVGAGPVAAAPAAGAPSLIRLDTVGFLPGEVKQAYLMSARAVHGGSFEVVDGTGRAVARGRVSAVDRGAWNARYPHVYLLPFSQLTTLGRYHLVLGDAQTRVTSPAFTVGAAGTLYGQMLADGVSFYQVQRDGSQQVPGPLNRQPSHLADARATVYHWPHFVDPANDDTIDSASLAAVAGHPAVDVAGGWFDAGDYLKFTHTTAYGDVVLYASARALGAAAPAALLAEARHGQSWLDKVWDQRTRTLYLQVGIGTGSTTGTFTGDHDLWRLPQTDDADTSYADRYATAHRPVFEAAPPGRPISPNLVGRVSAAFALAAQSDARRDPARAAAEYRAATSLYAMADTASPPSPLVTSLPDEYYPETSWHDDMELGAAEIALAGQSLGRDVSAYLRAGQRWARAYLATDAGSDTFNLYDTSALAHADLVTALRAGTKAGPASARRAHSLVPALVRDLRRQLDGAVVRARADVFAAGGNATDFDVDAHTFGLIATAGMYELLTGNHRYDGFATQQRGWLLGANAWGASFMVGEGSSFPLCTQHQVANLSGSTDGSRPIAVGAVVNGPNDASLFADGLDGLQDGMTACPADGVDRYAAFTGHGSRFVDDVVSWQTDEPALDMTGGAIIAAAYQEALALRNPAANG
jgi:endoglucanase